MAYLRSLRTWGKFGRGWTIRATGKDPKGEYAPQPGVVVNAIRMAGSAAPIEPEGVTDAGKAPPADKSITDILKKPEAWAPLGGLLSGLGSLFAGTGPVQWGARCRDRRGRRDRRLCLHPAATEGGVMFGLAFGTWLKVGAVLAVLGLLAWSHTAAYRAGKSTVLTKLQNDRITILQDGRKIDEKALNADDAGLCELLGGCGLPNDGAD